MKTEIKNLKRYIVEQTERCIHKPEGHLEHRFVTPTCDITPGADDHSDVPERSRIGHYLQMYDWDACYFAVGANKICPGLVDDVVKNFLNLINSSGYIPRTVSPRRFWDYGDMCKPFLCQSLMEAGDIDSLDDEKIQKLREYLEYFERHRKKGMALFGWRNALESGVDNSLALISPKTAAKDENTDVGNFSVDNYVSVDLSCYLYREYRAFAELLRNRGAASEAENTNRNLILLLKKLNSFFGKIG